MPMMDKMLNLPIDILSRCLTILLRVITRQVAKAMLSKVTPTPVSDPRLLGILRMFFIGVSHENIEGEDWLKVLSGNGTLSGMATYAHCYAGHQFGHWAGQLVMGVPSLGRD